MAEILNFKLIFVFYFNYFFSVCIGLYEINKFRMQRNLHYCESILTGVVITCQVHCD